MKVLGKRLPKDRFSWLVMIFLGVTMMGAAYGLQYWGEQYVSSGLAAVIFATAPLFVVIFAHFLLQEEKITSWKATGIAISFVGLLVIFWRDLMPVLSWNIQASLFGAFAEVLSAAATSLAIVVYKRYYAGIDRIVNLAVQTIIGAVFLLVLGLVWERSFPFNFSPVAIAAIVFLGLATTFPFVGYYWLLEKNSAINVSTIPFVIPILALVLGWVVLGEQITEITLLGGALILGGVYLTDAFANR
jgi:drug/metabolite transporter (DMT)-like permease